MEDEALLENREIYPNAPLRFVAFELFFPTVPEYSEQERLQDVFKELREAFPILGSSQEVSIALGVNGAVPTQRLRFRMLSRDRTSAVSLTSEMLSVETSRYTRYEDFRDVIESALNAIQAIATPAGVSRVALRYVDELRVRTPIESPSDWAPYVSQDLLAPLSVVTDPAAIGYEGRVVYSVPGGPGVQFRYGAFDGFSVDPNGPLRLPAAETGPYFLIDVVSSLETEELPEFDAAQVLEQCDQLRAPVREVFERSITDHLRDDVLRKGVADVAS